MATDDGNLEVVVNSRKEMGGSGAGTNPEQLFTAGHLRLDCPAEVGIGKISADILNVDAATAKDLIEKAHQAVSRAAKAALTCLVMAARGCRR